MTSTSCSRMRLPWLCGVGAVALLVAAPGTPPAAQESLPPRLATPGRVVFHPVFEPREAAFSLLVPEGWALEGGLYRVNPLVAGGPFNSMWPKCDLSIKRDRAGSTLIRFLPNNNFADFSHPRFAIQQRLFPPGATYQGGQVRPLPTVEDFLANLFRSMHSMAADVRMTYHRFPELAALVNQVHKPANDALQMMRLPTISADAGVLLVEYREGQVLYKEALLTALIDARGAAAYWCNSETVQLRAPAQEAAQWQPVMEVICRSFKVNPVWFSRELDKLDRVSRMLAETGARIREENHQLWQQRQKIMDRIDTDWMLYRTGQARYRNPFTGTEELDTSVWRHRWVTRLGDVIYTDDPNYNPNTDSSQWSNTWQMTPQAPG